MNVSVRSLTANYNHTVASTAGRELDNQGQTVHLSSLDVECSAETEDRDRTQFAFRWLVDQEEDVIELATVETPNDDSAPAERLNAAAEMADEIVHEFLKDVGLDMRMQNPLTSSGVDGRRADVFADLEVSA